MCTSVRPVAHTLPTAWPTGLLAAVGPRRTDSPPHRSRGRGCPQTVSVAEFPAPAQPYDAAFERTPPQDVAAEQCVLGGMLLSKDAIADVVEVLRPADFYQPAHQTLYDVVLDLYGRGEPADPVTVSAELTRRGEIARVGGAPYLHTLISSVPDRRQRRLLRPHRARARGAAPAGRGRDQDRPDGLRRRRQRGRRRRRPGPGRDLLRHRAPRQRGLPAARRRSCTAPSTRSRRSPRAAARWSGCRPGSPTSTA